MPLTPQRENNAARKIQRAWRARTGKSLSAKNKIRYFNDYRKTFGLKEGTPLSHYQRYVALPSYCNYKITERNVRMYRGELYRRQVKNFAKKLKEIAKKHKSVTVSYRSTPRPAYNFASHLKNASPGRAGYSLQHRPSMKQLAARAVSRTRQKRAALGLHGRNKSIRNMMAEKLVREKWVIPFLARRFEKKK